MEVLDLTYSNRFELALKTDNYLKMYRFRKKSDYELY